MTPEEHDKAVKYQHMMAYVYEECENSLYEFLIWAWKVLEPGKPFVTNWHIKSICEHLEAVYRRVIKKLMIFVPPRTSKSTLVSKVFPVWAWINDPHREFLTISNGIELATELAVQSKELIMSDWFQAGWGDKLGLSSYQNTKANYVNTFGGKRTALGISSAITGKGGDTIIIDDPHDAKKAMSSSGLERKSVIEAYDHGISTRLNDPKSSATILIMQRLHEEDLAGHLLEKEPGEWDILEFPMLYDPDRKCKTSLGVQDIRTEENELLWEARFDQKNIDDKKITLGPWGFASQMQQRPTPKEGGVIKITDFNFFEKVPGEILETAQFWDTAMKAGKHNDYWVCGTWARTATGYYLIDVFRYKLDYPDGLEMVAQKYQEFQPSVVVVEDKGTGSSLIQELRTSTTVPVLPYLPMADKECRMTVENASIRAGKVFLKMGASWLHDFISEMQHFPGGKHDDQIDMLSMAIQYFREKSTYGTFKMAVVG